MNFLGGKTQRKRKRNRKSRSRRRRSLKGGACPFAASNTNGPTTGGKRTRRRRHQKVKKQKGGLSSQLVPWALFASVLGSAKSRRHSKSSKSKRRR